MRGEKMIAHNYPLVQVTSTQGYHIQQNELRNEDRDHDDLPNYQRQNPIYNRLHTHDCHFQFQQVDGVEVQNQMLWKANHNETPDEVNIPEVV